MSAELKVQSVSGERIQLRRLDGYWFSYQGRAYTATWSPLFGTWGVAILDAVTSEPTQVAVAVDVLDAVREAVALADAQAGMTLAG